MSEYVCAVPRERGTVVPLKMRGKIQVKIQIKSGFIGYKWVIYRVELDYLNEQQRLSSGNV
jgi:hypothetical protein